MVIPFIRVDIESIPEPTDGGKGMEELMGDIDAKLLMKKLPRRQRMALKLFSEGYRYAEIAGKMGIKPETVHRHLTLARKKLKEILKWSVKNQ